MDQSDAELKEGDLEDEGKEDELEAILDEDSDEGDADLEEEGHAAGEDVRSSGSSEAGDAEESDAETDWGGETARVDRETREKEREMRESHWKTNDIIDWDTKGTHWKPNRNMWQNKGTPF